MWQTTALGAKSGRSVPDVSMLGYNPAFWVYSTSSDKCGISITAAAGWFSCAGTSLATPLWAGYLAIIEQIKGSSSLGNIAPSLYALHSGTTYSSLFHDISSGDNKYHVNGYQAGVGWDPVTGLGTPIADKLAATFMSDFSISTSASSLTIQQGSSGSSTVTVTSLNGFNSAVTLFVTGAPTGITASFSTNPLTPSSGGSTTALSVNASSSTSSGNYTLKVSGTSGSLSHSTSVLLTVSRSIPEFPFAIPILVTGIISLLVFYRMKSKMRF
jgi:subtilase family serine protease